MKYLFSVIGFFVGALLVRSMFLDNMEEMGWRLFWHELAQGNVGSGAIDQVSSSATFIKVALGGLVGAAVGGVTGERYAGTGGGQTKCPHCAELVKLEAKVCKHCGKDIVSRGWSYQDPRS